MVWLTEFISLSPPSPLLASQSEIQSFHNLHIHQVSLLLDALLAGDQINIHSCHATCGAYFALALAWFIPPSLRYTAVFAEREQNLYEARIVSYGSEFMESHRSFHVPLERDCVCSCSCSHQPHRTCRKDEVENGNICRSCISMNCNSCKDCEEEQHKDDAHAEEVEMVEEYLLKLDCPITCEHTIVHVVVCQNALLHVFTQEEYLERLNFDADKPTLVKPNQNSLNHYNTSTLTAELVCLLTESLPSAHIVHSKSQLQCMVTKATQLVYKYAMYGSVYLTLFCDQKVRHAFQSEQSYLNNTEVNKVQTVKKYCKTKQEQVQSEEHSHDTIAHHYSLQRSTDIWRELQNVLSNSSTLDKTSNSETSELPSCSKKDHNILVFLGGATIT